MKLQKSTSTKPGVEPKTVCEINQCAGCMACVDICPKDAIHVTDELSHYNAVIREEKCIGCNACHKVCQHNHSPEFMPPMKWYQGWTVEESMRKTASSGGIASVLSQTFLAEGGMVCSCVFQNGEFRFAFAGTEAELRKFAGSKYVKSNPQGVYSQIRKLLKENKKILFIGLPCQAAALKNFVKPPLDHNLYIVDLICHGTPSPKVLELFLKQHGYSLSLRDIRFRTKAKFQIYGDYKGIATPGVCDRYSIAFLNSMTYTENCYHCQYAKRERVSDLTLGDSWGSELSIEELKKGVSLVLCQTDKGRQLLENSKIHLEDVDIEKAIKNNHQLNAPSRKPEQWNTFFRRLEEGRGFDKLVSKYFPKQCFRQDVKNILIKLKMLRGGVNNYGILFLLKQEMKK